MNAARERIGAHGDVLAQRMREELSPDEFRALYYHPPKPYISVYYNDHYSPKLLLNAGEPFVFLAEEPREEELLEIFTNALVADQLLDSHYYGAQPLQKPQPKTRDDPPEEPVYKPEIPVEKYQVTAEARINAAGQISTVKIEKKAKQSSIMGFIKKK